MAKKAAFLLTVLLFLLLSFSLLRQIVTAFRSGDRLSRSLEQLSKLEAQNADLKKKLAESQSLGFVEAQARDKLNLVKAGETVVIIDQKKLQAVLGAYATQSAQIKLPNWQGWLKLFWH